MFIRRMLLALGLGATMWLGLGIVRRALASDETLIRWRLEDMFEGFERAELASVMDGFAPGYVDVTSGIRRAEVRDALVHLFFTELDPSTGEFVFDAELATDELEIELTQPGHATVAMHVRFSRSKRGANELFWDARVRGEMVESGDGWQWLRTTEVNHADRRRL